MLEERRDASCLTCINPSYLYLTSEARESAKSVRESLTESEDKEEDISREGSARRETMMRPEGVSEEDAERSESRA